MDKKGIKAKLYINLKEFNLQELKVQLFSYKNVSQLASKIVLLQFFFTDHLKYGIVNNTTCRKTSANLYQL